jgi:hypothetical protein
MESFQDPKAAAAFREALEIDRFVAMPKFASPKALRLFEEVKATMPAPALAPVMAEPPPMVTAEPAPSRPSTNLAWIPIGVGGAAVATGATLLVLTRGVDSSLRNGTAEIHSAADLQATVNRGKTFQTSGAVLVGVGAAALVGGLVWKLSPEFMPLLSWQVAPQQDGFAAAVSGTFP